MANEPRGFFIAGTDTGVGKTLVACAVAAYLRGKGSSAAVMKPVETGVEDPRSSDAFRLTVAAGAGGEGGAPALYSFRLPLAPWVAAREEGRVVDLEEILRRFSEISEGSDFTVVEGCGGLLVPLTASRTVADLAAGMGLPLLVVARADLGTLNHTLLTLESAAARGLEVAGVILNQTSPTEGDPSVESNAKVLSELTTVPVLGVLPHLSGAGELSPAELSAWLEEHVDIELAVRPRTASPETRTAELKNRDLRFLWHPFTQMFEHARERPPVIVRGEGSYLWDSGGRRYLDGVSSLWVTVHGHRHPHLDAAVRRQLGRIAHTTLLGLSHPPAIELAERLAKISPPGLARVFYSDNGSAAVEVAIKIAFQYWRQRGGPEDGAPTRDRFIALTNAYHGDTVGAMSLGGIELFHGIYRPLLFEVDRVEAPYCYRCRRGLEPSSCVLACLEDLETLLEEQGERVAAVVVEPMIQAAAGMLVWPRGYLARVKKLCERHGPLLIADEVATGFGRTGKMFACDMEEVTPDIMCLAKGLTGGYLPLAATLTTDQVFGAFLGPYEELKTFFHGHTYTGNPLACAAALASLEVFEEEATLGRVGSNVPYLAEELRSLEELPNVGDIRQLGYMVGIELVREKEGRVPYEPAERAGHRVTLEARSRGLIIRPLGNVVVLMPPLSASRRELGEMVGILRESIPAACRRPASEPAAVTS